MTRSEARAAGVTKYSGRPCLKGHSGVRWVQNCACVECLKSRRKRHRATHPEKKWASRALYRERNGELLRAINRKSYSANRSKRIEEIRRRAEKTLPTQTPAWADRKAIERFYWIASLVSEMTGVPHVVDHVIPLRGKNVCGLHVETNLDVIPSLENDKKGNKYVVN